MKISTTFYTKCILLIAGLFPLTLLAHPHVGDVCDGYVTLKDHETCRAVQLGGRHNDKIYTYSITFINFGSKPGYFYSKQAEGNLGPLINSKEMSTMTIDSHYCSGGSPKVNELLVAGTGIHPVLKNYVAMKITGVRVIKVSPLSDFVCAN